MPSSVVPGDKSLKQVWSPGSLTGVYTTAESIASKDLNNLYRTSCYFTDPGKYRAFCALYAVMRIVDDRIDEVLSEKEISEEGKRREEGILEAWHRIVSSCLAGLPPDDEALQGSDCRQIDELLTTFLEALELFPVPASLWENFFHSMRWDLEQRGFGTYAEFVEYAEGASVAPATIYLYLITASRSGEDQAYRPPEGFDLIQCGRDLGLFAYLAHIMRDLSRDLSAGERGLLYLTAEDMAAYGVTEQTLSTDLESGSASEPLRSLIQDLIQRAWTSVCQGRLHMQTLEKKLDTDCMFVLELIVRIYEEVIEKIVSCSYDVMTDRHRLTDLEKMQVAVKTAESMGLTLG